MTSGQIRNFPASVHQRLLNLARERGENFNRILQRYAAERFLYRLSISPLVDEFTLKGAALYRVWSGQEMRPTNDVDFLASLHHDREEIDAALAVICNASCTEDGVVFESTTIRTGDIRQGQEHGGMRVQVGGTLGQARLHLQVDVGFGDVITPEREQQDYPTLLDLPVPRLWTYPRETLVSEKFEAMVSLGARNTRVKDLWDIACMARLFSFDGEVLRTAVEETFRRRRTRLGEGRPLALLPSYYEDPGRTQRWKVLRREMGPGLDRPVGLVDAGDEIRRFLGPVSDSLTEETPFTRRWPASGPWQADTGQMSTGGMR